jgi:hypothetical protein
MAIHPDFPGIEVGITLSEPHEVAKFLPQYRRSTSDSEQEWYANITTRYIAARNGKKFYAGIRLGP